MSNIRGADSTAGCDRRALGQQDRHSGSWPGNSRFVQSNGRQMWLTCNAVENAPQSQTPSASGPQYSLTTEAMSSNIPVPSIPSPLLARISPVPRPGLAHATPAIPAASPPARPAQVPPTPPAIIASQPLPPVAPPTIPPPAPVAALPVAKVDAPTHVAADAAEPMFEYRLRAA